jgi:hypothetical protein
MKIECPNCKFAGNAPDDLIAEQPVFATCPKCKTKFEVSRLAVPEQKPVFSCPKCGVSQNSADSCINCGLVFAKYYKAQEMKEPQPQENDEIPTSAPPQEESKSPRYNFKLLLLIPICVAIGVWFYFTPHLAVRGMKSAATARDSAKLSSYVNFPALKEDFKASLNAKLAAEMSKEKEANPFAALGAAMAAAFISPLVDALVTPESLALIMQGDKPLLGKSKPQAQKTDTDTDTSMAYEGFNRFVVTVRKKDTTLEPISLVFNRDGLFTWKLSAIRLSL